MLTHKVDLHFVLLLVKNKPKNDYQCHVSRQGMVAKPAKQKRDRHSVFLQGTYLTSYKRGINPDKSIRRAGPIKKGGRGGPTLRKSLKAHG